MKTTSNALFRLIKAMTKGEKIYFKKFAAASATSKATANYTKLFDAIAKAEEYDEEALLKKFRREVFVKNFVETKQYLKSQILKALRNYKSNKSILFKLREDISDIELLIEKGVLDLARTQIKKSLKVAEEHELFHYAFELHRLLLKVAEILLDYKAIDAYLVEQIPTEKKWLQQLNHLNYYYERYLKMVLQSKKQGLVQPEVAEVDLEAHPLDSFNTSDIYLRTKLNVNQIIGGKVDFYEDAKAHYNLFKQYPAQINLRPFSFLVALGFYANSCARYNQLEEGLSLIEEGLAFLDQLRQKNKIPQRLWVDHSVKLRDGRFRLYFHHGSADLFRKEHHVFKAFLDDHKGQSPTVDFYVRSLLFSEIILEDWEIAEESYRELVNNNARGYRGDLESVARLLGILIYYEQGKQTLLETSLDAAYQYARTKDFLFQFIRQFINFFKHKIISAVDKQEELEHFKAFKTQILAFFEEHPEERKVLVYFNFIAWLDSKIEQTSIYEAYWQGLQTK